VCCVDCVQGVIVCCIDCVQGVIVCCVCCMFVSWEKLVVIFSDK
jgi:hypothetical protein